MLIRYLPNLKTIIRGRVIHLTRNIDNLMEKAGAKDLIHLHGTFTDLRCEACAQTFYVEYAPQEGNEHCPHCGNKRVRHNIVMFGEAAPEYSHIQESIRHCTLFIAIGTSGAVIEYCSYCKRV